MFRVDVLRFPTISSLAFGIFRSNFLLKDIKIPLIFNEIYKDIKDSYTGGSVDVFKPYGAYGENIKCYDVNSLYPFVMANENMPVGIPTYFEGDITKINSNAFGFFEVEIKAPLDLYVPLLQIKIKTDNGNRTIAPVGSWVGTYFSEELIEAKNLGYEYKILRGYLFEKDKIFENYILDLYSLKKNSPKNSALYIIIKLLLNSLYGKFGMSPELDSHIILNNDEALEKYHTNDKLVVTNTIDLDNDRELISYHTKEDSYNSKWLNISIPIAVAITSYARIFMSKFKNSLKDNLYYSDTDSLYLDVELDPKYVSELELGKFKLEKKFIKALFLSPKMYAGKFLNNKGIIENYAKIKGVKNNVNFIKLIKLLYKGEHLDLVQEKWIREWEKGSIRINDKTPHTLKISSFKRNVIYSFKNLLKFIRGDSDFKSG